MVDTGLHQGVGIHLSDLYQIEEQFDVPLMTSAIRQIVSAKLISSVNTTHVAGIVGYGRRTWNVFLGKLPILSDTTLHSLFMLWEDMVRVCSVTK